MKRIFIIISIFLLTGCFGETGKGYLTKTCTKITSINDVNKEETIIIKQKDNLLINIDIMYKYTVKSASKSLESLILGSESEKLNLNGYSGLSISSKEENNSYSIVYNFDFANLDSKIKEKYKFEEYYSNQVKKYENEGYECK